MSKTRGILFLTSKVRPRLLLLVVLPTVGLIVVNAIERAATPLHPIEYLHQHHSKIFQAKLARQSKSLPEAVKEYRRRNHRHPPPGFGVWYSIARKHKFELIDEFDTIMSNINSLWQVPPTILRSRLQSARDSMLRLDFGNGQVNKTSDSYHGVSVERWLEPFFRAGVFSDVSFLINELDEPRIIPVNFDPVREEDFVAHADTTISNSRREKHVVWHNLGQHPWIIPKYRPKGTSIHSVNDKPTMPPFVTSLRNSRDLGKLLIFLQIMASTSHQPLFTLQTCDSLCFLKEHRHISEIFFILALTIQMPIRTIVTEATTLRLSPVGSTSLMYCTGVAVLPECITSWAHGTTDNEHDLASCSRAITLTQVKSTVKHQQWPHFSKRSDWVR